MRVVDEGVWQEVNAPRLKTALARAAYASDANADAEALLCEWFGVPRQQDWPLAPLLAKEDGLPASIGYWLCATPLHLETRRNALVAASTDQLPIGESESAAFAATHRVIGWNAPGFMLTDALLAETPTCRDYADAVAAFADAVGLWAAQLDQILATRVEGREDDPLADFSQFIADCNTGGPHHPADGLHIYSIALRTDGHGIHESRWNYSRTLEITAQNGDPET